MRPDDISNGIRLAYEVATPVSAFISEHGAVDSFLPAVIAESSPHKHCISLGCAQDDALARADKPVPDAPVLVLIGRVVSFIQFKAIKVTVLRKPPNRGVHAQFHTLAGLLMYLLRRSASMAEWAVLPLAIAPVPGVFFMGVVALGMHLVGKCASIVKRCPFDVLATDIYLLTTACATVSNFGSGFFYRSAEHDFVLSTR